MTKTVNGGSWEEYRNLLLTQMEQVFTALEEVKRNTEVAATERVHLDIKMSALLVEQSKYRTELDKFKIDLETLRQQFNDWMREQMIAKATQAAQATPPSKKPTEALVEEIKQKWQLYAIIILTIADLISKYWEMTSKVKP